MDMETANTLDEFTGAYIEAMLWAETDDEGESLDANYGPDDLEPESRAKIVKDCEEFQVRYRALWNGCETGRGEYGIDEKAGHDFWLNRNRHGTGFWDSEDVYGQGMAQVLDLAAQEWGEVHVFIQDGMVWID